MCSNCENSTKACLLEMFKAISELNEIEKEKKVNLEVQVTAVEEFDRDRLYILSPEDRVVYAHDFEKVDTNVIAFVTVMGTFLDEEVDAKLLRKFKGEVKIIQE